MKSLWFRFILILLVGVQIAALVACGPQGVSRSPAKPASLASDEGSHYEGGSDGGGGGLLFYRTIKALALVQEMVGRTKPADLEALPKSEKTEPAKAFARVSEDLNSLLAGLKVRVVSRSAMKDPLKPMEVKNGELLVSEKFDDGSLNHDNINKMKDQVADVLWAAVQSLDLPFYESIELNRALMAHAEKTPLSQKPAFRQKFAYSDEVSFEASELMGMKKTAVPAASDFDSRLKRAKEIAHQSLQTALAKKDNRWTPSSGEIALKYGTRLTANLREIRILSTMKEDKSLEEFYSKHARYDQGTIEFTKAIRYARLDELVFLILHEITHSVPSEKVGDELEHTINVFALDVLSSARRENPGLAAELDQDLFTVLFTLDDIKNDPSKRKVLVENIEWNKVPFLAVAPRDPKRESKEEYDAKFARARQLCRWFGFDDVWTWTQVYFDKATEFDAAVFDADGQPRVQHFTKTSEEYATAIRSAYCRLYQGDKD